MRLAPTLFLAVVLTGVSGCTQTIDFKQALQVTDVTGGWYDFGIVDGKNKLVPMVSFRVRKAPGTNLKSISVNVHFRQTAAERKDEVELDEVFLQSVEFTEGDQTSVVTVRTDHGYTGDPPQTRAQMLQHSGFKDARARVFAKQSSTTWVELVSYDIPRVLITK